METKRELNDILINDDDLQKQNRTKKLMMMVGVAIVFLCILIAVAFIITRDEDELGEKITAANNGLTPLETSPIQETQNSGFVNVPIDNNASSDDRFQQILDDIRNRNGDTSNQVAQNTAQPTSSTPPLTTPTQQAAQPKPTQQETQKQPVLPNNTTAPKKQEPAKPTQTANNTSEGKKPEPAKPAPTPAQTQAQTQKPQPTQTAAQATTQTNSVANAFENVATSPMDRSKNGQVATKGFYVQVGSFANKPSEEFLKKIGNYSYRVYAGTSSNGQQTTKYLIGPYTSRTEAARDLPNFKSLVADPVHFEVK